MFVQFYNSRFYLILGADLVLFAMAFVGAYLLRFDFTLEPVYRAQILRLLPFLLPGKILIFFLFGMYRGMWRYTSLNDLWRLVQASFLAMLFYISATLYIHGSQGIPRSVFLLDAMLTFLLCGGLRMSIRLFYAATHSYGLSPSILSNGNNLRSPKKSVIIIGAGGAGEKMLWEIKGLPNPDPLWWSSGHGVCRGPSV